MEREWQPITDYEVEWTRIADAELPALLRVWKEQRERLRDRTALREFEARLCREWAIETGLLERLYTLDRGVTRLLIEHGIDEALIPHDRANPDPGLVAAMINDQQEAVEWLLDLVGGAREISNSFIRELHQLMTRHQSHTEAYDPVGGQLVRTPLLRGDWKRWPNNPVRPSGEVHQYCPPEHVAAEMDRLLALHTQHRSAGVTPEVEAAWLHHRFTQIHPFQDGNGRVARALATLVLLQAGCFPLVIHNDQRATYIDACESADAGDLGPLAGLFARNQRDAIVQALSLVEEALQAVLVSETIAAAAETLRRRSDALVAESNQVRELAVTLLAAAQHRLEEISAELNTAVGAEAPESRFSVDSAGSGDGERARWNRAQVIQVAREFGYFANTDEYSAWTRLALEVDHRSEILVSCHALGRDFRGLLACSACFYRRVTGEDGRGWVDDITPLAGDYFQMNYAETPEQVSARFSNWLETALAEGLVHWRRTL